MSSSKNLNDKWFRIIGITGVALVAQVLFYRDMNQARGISFLKGYVHSIFRAWMLREFVRQMIIYTRKRFSSFEESDKRINYTLILVSLTTIVLMGAICAVYNVTKFWGYHFHAEKIGLQYFYCTIFFENGVKHLSRRMH